MDPFILMYLGMAAFPILILGILWLARLSQVSAWRALAEQHGLQFEGSAAPWSNLRVSGTYRGRQLRLDVITHGTSKNKHSYTRVVITARSRLIPQMELKPDGIFEVLGKMVGWQDIEIGDEQIDKTYNITGQPVAEVLKVFASLELRQRLLEQPNIRLSIRGSDVACERSGIQKDADKLRQLFDLLTTLVEQAERAGEPAR